jgi:diguanylate cyclase (GGDEF)-like protein
MESEQNYFKSPEEQRLYAMCYDMAKITGALVCRVVQLEEELRIKTEEANRDHTTKLLNSNAVEAIGNKWVEEEKPFVAIYFDLLNFKKVNDTCGHEIGNVYLRSVGEMIAKNTKKNDFVARIGGDEFIVLLDTAEAIEEKHMIAHYVIDRTSTLIDDYNSANFSEIDNIGISGGYAIFDPNLHTSLSSVISEADISMSLNKKQQHINNKGSYR